MTLVELREAEGEFIVSIERHHQMWRDWLAGRISMFDSAQVPPSITDPDAFTQHGGEHAIERWADDGGPA